jgi:hypothetical protein
MPNRELNHVPSDGALHGPDITAEWESKGRYRGLDHWESPSTAVFHKFVLEQAGTVWASNPIRQIRSRMRPNGTNLGWN